MKQILVSFGRAAAASVVMISLAVPVKATVVATYSTRAAWEGSLTAIQTVDFNETMSSGGDMYQSYSTSSGYTDPSGLLKFLGLNQITPSPSAYDLYRTTTVVGGLRVLRGPIWGGGAGDERLVVNVQTAATRGFGVDIASSIPGITYQFTVDGEVLGTFTAGTTTTFFGLRTDTDISQIFIRAISPAFGTETYLDSASIGQAGGVVDPPPSTSDTPEPSTIISLGAGLALLAVTRYRRASSKES